MEDQIHPSQNHISISYANDTSQENFITLFRNLFSTGTESVQNHDQSSIFSSNATTSATYSVQDPTAEETNIQEEAIRLMGQAPIPTVGIERMQSRPSHHIPQQFNLPRSLFPNVTGSVQNHDQSSVFSSNATSSATFSVQEPTAENTNIQEEAIRLMGQAPIPTGGIDTMQLRPYSSPQYNPQQFNLPRSLSGVDRANGSRFYANPMGKTIDSGSLPLMNNFGVPPQRNSVLGLRPKHSVTEDINGINGGFWGGFLNDSRLDSDDPSLLNELRDFHIIVLAKNLKGSQYLKRILESNSAMITGMILKAVVSSDIVDLMTNEFGKHTFHKLLDLCEPQQIQQLVVKLATQEDALFRASINLHGSLCVKKLIKTVKRSSFMKLEISHIMAALAPRIPYLMVDPTGTHIISTCLESLDRRQNYIIFEVAKNCCLELAVQEKGCVNLNSCIDQMIDPLRSEILRIIIDNSVYLAQEPYGNFVIQHVLKKHNPSVNMNICHKLQGLYVRLSMQKSGSHVVETCAKFGGITYVINALVNSDKLVQVAKNPFGNYVIQTALKAAKGPYVGLHQSLEIALQPHLAELQFHPIGRNVYNLIHGGIPINRIRPVLFSKYC